MTANGSVDIEDVRKVYDELTPWDKRKFVMEELLKMF